MVRSTSGHSWPGSTGKCVGTSRTPSYSTSVIWKVSTHSASAHSQRNRTVSDASIWALALGRALSSLVFGVRATDPLTFAAVSLLLGLVALAACAVPALRASRVHPTEALNDN